MAARGYRRRRKRRAWPGILALLVVACLGASTAACLYAPDTVRSTLGRAGINADELTVVGNLINRSFGPDSARGELPQTPGQAPASTQRATTARPSAEGTALDPLPDWSLVNDRALPEGMAESRPQEFPTPLIAEYGSLVLHSPIKASKLTGVLFHQASYDYALQLETQLPEGNAESIIVNHDFGIAEEQPTGNHYLTALALHVWREDYTAMDTAIDVGAAKGSTVYAPVSGTVVLVKDYRLFDLGPDIELHIQPEGMPDLDVVVLHITDPQVQPGDVVEGGRTPIAKVRNIASYVYDIQLTAYTAEDDPGNHAHVQVNDVNYEDYRATRLAGAFNPQTGEFDPIEPVAPEGEPAGEEGMLDAGGAEVAGVDAGEQAYVGGADASGDQAYVGDQTYPAYSADQGYLDDQSYAADRTYYTEGV